MGVTNSIYVFKIKEYYYGYKNKGYHKVLYQAQRVRQVERRVLDRVSNTRDDGETNEVLRDVWNQADSAYMEEEEISTAYKRIFETKGTKEKTEMKTIESSILQE